jgi:hypothetical protein
MNSDWPLNEDYQQLYAKYLQSGTSPQTMLERGEFKPGDRVLDLAAGCLLRVSKAAFEAGAGYVVAIDPTLYHLTVYSDDLRHYSVIECFPPLAKLFGSEDWQVDDNIHHIYLDSHTVEWSLKHYSDFPDVQFDVVICQQAINYWFNKECIKHLVKLIVPGKKLVFNTFYRKPPTYPDWKTYIIDGKVYGEAFYRVDYRDKSIVYHWQAKEGIKPHFTAFRYITRNEFVETLEPYFKVIRTTEYNSDLYVCVKK